MIHLLFLTYSLPCTYMFLNYGRTYESTRLTPNDIYSTCILIIPFMICRYNPRCLPRKTSGLFFFVQPTKLKKHDRDEFVLNWINGSMKACCENHSLSGAQTVSLSYLFMAIGSQSNEFLTP